MCIRDSLKNTAKTIEMKKERIDLNALRKEIIGRWNNLEKSTYNKKNPFRKVPVFRTGIHSEKYKGLLIACYFYFAEFRADFSVLYCSEQIANLRLYT